MLGQVGSHPLELENLLEYLPILLTRQSLAYLGLLAAQVVLSIRSPGGGLSAKTNDTSSFHLPCWVESCGLDNL